MIALMAGISFLYLIYIYERLSEFSARVLNLGLSATHLFT